MGFKRARNWLKWSFAGLAGITLLLLAAALGAYWARISIAQYFLDRTLAANGFADSRVAISRLEWDQLTAERGLLSSDAFTLSFESIDIRYDLKTAWNERTLDSIEVRGVKLNYDLKGPSTFDPSELDALIKKGIPFPLNSLAIPDAELLFQTEKGPLAYQSSFQLTKGKNQRILGSLAAQSGTESLTLDLILSDRFSFSFKTDIPNISKTLSHFHIEDLEALGIPADVEIEPTSLSATAEGEFDGISLINASVQTRLGPLEIRVGPGKGNAEIEQVTSNFQMTSSDIRNIDTKIHLRNARIGPLQIKPTQILLTGSSAFQPNLSLAETDWSLDGGESGRIDARVTARLKSDYTLDRFEISGEINELKSDAFTIEPFHYHAEGNLSVITLSLTDLANPSLSWLSLSNFEATIEEPLGNQTSVKMGATLLASNENLPENASPSPIEGTWNLAGDLAINATPLVLQLALQSPEGAPIAIAGGAPINGRSDLNLSLNYWPESNEASTSVNFSSQDAGFILGAASAESIGLGLQINTKPIALASLSDPLDNFQDLADFLGPSIEYSLEFQGNELRLDPETSFRWFSGKLQSISLESLNPTDRPPIAANLDLLVGIASSGVEQGQQLEIHSQFRGNARNAIIDSNATALFEGEPITLRAKKELRFENSTLEGTGEFELSGIHFSSSDIIDRHSPKISGTALSADLALQGKAHIHAGEWDAETKIQIANGSFSYPAEEIYVTDLSGEVNFDSVAQLRTPPSQSLRAGVLKFGDIESNDLKVLFSMPNANEIFLEAAQLDVFEGSVSLDPVTLSLNRSEVSLLLRFKGISVAPVISMMDFFDGQVTGRLNGTLPFRLVKGRPVFGEGYLELDPDSKATFSYNATGMFTNDAGPGAPKKSMADKLLERLELEPNSLIEGALGNVAIQQLRVDLFNKNFPETPMRIQLAGLANTGKATIPIAITTNVNGTVAELLNFLTRLDSLGLVAAKQRKK